MTDHHRLDAPEPEDNSPPNGNTLDPLVGLHIAKCECGGKAAIAGTPGYLIVRCPDCAKGGLYCHPTKRGRIKAIKAWNKQMQPNSET